MGTIVVVLHSLRAKRRPHKVSSLFLWARVERELAANHRRRRLIKSLLLLLQLLILSLLAFALAGPSLPKPREPFSVGIIVDTSASMAVGDARSRAALAKERIEGFLSEGQADRYLLWATTGDLLYYDGSSKEELLAELAKLPPPAGISAWERLYERIAATVADSTPFHILIATDGAVDPDQVTPLRLVGPEVSLHLIDVGQSTDNLAITGFSARPSGRADGHHQVLIHVANFGRQSVRTQLRVVAHRPSEESTPATESVPDGGDLVYATALDLSPGTSERLLFEHTFLPGERLVAQIQSDDAFPVDDVAYLIANPHDATRILLVGEENHFLSQGFSSFPQVETAHSFDPFTSLDRDVHYDLVVFHAEEVPDGFEGSALVFESEPASAGVPAEITWWDRRHPVLRFVDWQLVSVGLVQPLPVGPGESVLLQSTAGPLITLLEEPGRRIIRVAIPLGQSDFPFRVAFPVFLQNVLDWINPEGQVTVPPASSLGRLPQAALAAWSEGGPLTLRLPSMEIVDLGEFTGALSDATAVLTQPGIYAWRARLDEGSFALSLLDPEESDLSERLVDAVTERGGSLIDDPIDRLGDLTPEASPDPEDATNAYVLAESTWIWVSLVVLALLLIEGHLYTSRRVKGVPDRGHRESGVLSGVAVKKGTSVTGGDR